MQYLDIFIDAVLDRFKIHILDGGDENLTQIKILAHVWRSNMADIFRQEYALPGDKFKIMKMDQIFDDSQEFFVELGRFLEIPLTVTQLNDLEYSTRSETYWTFFDGILSLKTPHHWKTQLSQNEIEIIENICHSEMAHLGYSLISR